MLNVSQSYVYAQQQGLLNRVGNFFSGNPNSQQQVYILAQQKIQNAARQSPLLAEAREEHHGHARRHAALPGIPAGHRDLQPRRLTRIGHRGHLSQGSWRFFGT